MIAATNGSLEPSGIGHPFWKGSTDKRDPLSKRKRTKLILSRMTIVEDDYDYKGRGNVTNIDFQPPKCISLSFLISWVQGEIARNRGIDIRANWLFWSAWTKRK